MAMTSAWLRCTHPRPDDPLRLVCLPYAGAGASAFLPWTAPLAGVAEVWAAQLPGRERRLAEPPAGNMAELVPPLLDAVTTLVRPPFAIFGHSMGALLGYELARHLVERGGPVPQRLVVSAARPPGAAPTGDGAYRLDDAALTGWLRALGGMPAEMLDDAGLLELILPAVRADLCVVASYRPDRSEPLPCPVDAVAAADDPLVTPAEVGGWNRYTTAGFSLTVVPGGHVYLHDRPPPLRHLLTGRSPGAPGTRYGVPAHAEGGTR